MGLPFVELHGDAYSQGREHGRALRAEIAHNLAVYFERFAREAKLARDEVLQRANRYAAQIREQNYDYYEGMRGIAESSGFTFAEIVALNVRYELFYYQFGQNALARADGCTAFALLPAATAHGRMLLGENWDWIVDVRGAVLHTRYNDGLRSLAFSEAGIFGGKIGLNSAGVALAINGLTSNDDDWARLARPFHVRCYEVLRAWNFDQAVSVITAEDRSCSTNFLIGGAPDNLVNLEAAPSALNAFGCEAGCLVHANHFVDPARLGIVEPEIERNPHSYWRAERLEALLRAAGRVDMTTLQTSLRDHHNFPYSVCFHPDPEEIPEERYATLTSAIIDPSVGELWLSDGSPCSNPYQRYTV